MLMIYYWFIKIKINKKYIYTLNKIIFSITRIIAFKVNFQISSKIVFENKTLEQILHFKYLGCNKRGNIDINEK